MGIPKKVTGLTGSISLTPAPPDEQFKKIGCLNIGLPKLRDQVLCRGAHKAVDTVSHFVGINCGFSWQWNHHKLDASPSQLIAEIQNCRKGVLNWTRPD